MTVVHARQGERTALVTGASSGIGLATARLLAEQGWQVVAGVRRTSDGVGGLSGVDVLELDVTDAHAVELGVAAVIERYGTLDLLVNNAGVGCRGSLEQLSMKEIESCLDVNLMGVIRMTRAVLPHMREAGRGRIVTVTSLNGVIGLPFNDAYNAAKFAVEGLLEGLAPVAAAFGVHISMIEPGPVRTSFVANLMGADDADPTNSDDPYAALAAAYRDSAGDRMAAGGERPEDVAAVIVRAATDDDPSLRYQSSAAASAIASRKLVDPTGRSVLEATLPMIGVRRP